MPTTVLRLLFQHFLNRPSYQK